MKTIDFHVHAYPDLAKKLGLSGPLEPLKRLGNDLTGGFKKKLFQGLHKAQTEMRSLPSWALGAADAIGGLSAVPSTLLESTVDDLIATMKANEVDGAVLIAHPPFIPNELVLEAGQTHKNIFPAVNISQSEKDPAQSLRKMAKAGARVLKIHPAADGEGAYSARYHSLLAAADELGLPVIIHTGCLHNRLLYKDPEQGHVERFETWFAQYTSVPFVLAHMNFHFPEKAITLSERYPNLYVDISWQPTPVIAGAIERLGAGKVLFASDWPLLGDNMTIHRQRMRELENSGAVTAKDLQKVMGLNAKKILGLAK